MATITRHDGTRWVTEDLKISAKPKPKRSGNPKLRPSEETVVGIIGYLKLAETDWERYRDVLDQFMKDQPAAIMKAVAARRMNCAVPRTKADAKRLLVKAHNLSALSRR